MFGAGTVQWSWGLDANHDRGDIDAGGLRMQQATVNLFADMGVQPADAAGGPGRRDGIHRHDALRRRRSPRRGGRDRTGGRAVTITGTAADTAAASVAGVEVSTDGGATWHPATGGSELELHAGRPATAARQRSRQPRRRRQRQHRDAAAATGVTCHAAQALVRARTLAAGSQPRLTRTTTMRTPIEVGVKFRADVAGFITGVRFYKATANTGTHVGNLWTAAGQLLATVTFTGETATGWQQANFASPIAITANTTYVASYHTQRATTRDDGSYFGNGIDNGPLHALADGAAAGNGVYMYSAGRVPDPDIMSTNYWVDVVFSNQSSGNSGPVISGVAAAPTATTADQLDHRRRLRLVGRVQHILFIAKPDHDIEHLAGNGAQPDVDRLVREHNLFLPRHIEECGRHDHLAVRRFAASFVTAAVNALPVISQITAKSRTQRRCDRLLDDRHAVEPDRHLWRQRRIVILRRRQMPHW